MSELSFEQMLEDSVKTIRKKHSLPLVLPHIPPSVPY